jgi:acyl carrier protein
MAPVVRDIVAEVTGVPAGELTQESAVGEVPGWDSLATLEILSLVEERCGVRLALEELVELKTLGDWERRVGR